MAPAATAVADFVREDVTDRCRSLTAIARDVLDGGFQHPSSCGRAWPVRARQWLLPFFSSTRQQMHEHAPSYGARSQRIRGGALQVRLTVMCIDVDTILRKMREAVSSASRISGPTRRVEQTPQRRERLRSSAVAGAAARRAGSDHSRRQRQTGSNNPCGRVVSILTPAVSALPSPNAHSAFDSASTEGRCAHGGRTRFVQRSRDEPAPGQKRRGGRWRACAMRRRWWRACRWAT